VAFFELLAREPPGSAIVTLVAPLPAPPVTVIFPWVYASVAVFVDVAVLVAVFVAVEDFGADEVFLADAAFFEATFFLSNFAMIFPKYVSRETLFHLKPGEPG